VLVEALSLIGEKLEPSTANQILDRLIEGAHFDISHVPKADFNAAQALFRRYDELSLVDTTIATYMDREGIEYLYSFDNDFDVLDGITRLDTTTNLFTA